MKIKSSMHIGELILKSLKEKERNMAWLARKVNRNDANLGRLLKNSQHIHSELLLRISIALEEDFFAYYSEVVKKYSKNSSTSL
jgi:plasmid maintenance system antidote protein VapI